MKAVILNTLAAANAAEALLSKAEGIPPEGLQGSHVGGGGGAPALPAKTTLRFADVRKHPTLSKWAVLLRDRDVIRFLSAKAEAFLTTSKTTPTGEVIPSRLTQAEYDLIKSRLLTAINLPDDWRTVLVR